MGIAPRREAISQARHAVSRLLTHWGITTDIVERAELIVSELLSNALRHAAPGEIGLQVVEEHGAVLVEVEDGGSNNCRQTPSFAAWTGGRTADGEAEHGRGLHLVEELGQGWGWRRLGNGHHSVWAYVEAAESRGAR
ncbi:ATP-binding protein [Streptomyces sp. L500]